MKTLENAKADLRPESTEFVNDIEAIAAGSYLRLQTKLNALIAEGLVDAGPGAFPQELRAFGVFLPADGASSYLERLRRAVRDGWI